MKKGEFFYFLKSQCVFHFCLFDFFFLNLKCENKRVTIFCFASLFVAAGVSLVFFVHSFHFIYSIPLHWGVHKHKHTQIFCMFDYHSQHRNHFFKKISIMIKIYCNNHHNNDTDWMMMMMIRTKNNYKQQLNRAKLECKKQQQQQHWHCK